MLQNLGYSLRMLRRSPAFTITAILTLALGIGANIAIFSVLDAVLLRPLPFGHPDRLVWGWGKTVGTDLAGIAPTAFRDYRAQNRTFDQLAAFEVFVSNTALTGSDKPEQVKMGIVSANFFDTLGLTPLAGRSFILEDEQQNFPQVAILGRGFWLQHFGGAPVIGKRVTLDGDPVTIVGVLPDASLIQDAQVWVPTPNLNPDMNIRRSHFMMLIGRLKQDASFQQAQADLDVIAHRLGEQYPDSDKGWSVRLQPLNEKLVGNVRGVLLTLLSAVGLVLLIACANVANLLLVRASGRQREVAIRSALGASRGILIRQFLTESLLLALAGGAVAVLLALWGVDALRVFGPANLPRLNEIRVDGTVLGFALLLSLATGLVFGAAPALRFTKGDLQTPLRASQGGSPAHTRGLGGVLVAVELAISLVLLISAGLAVKSVWKLIQVDPGFRPAHTAMASIGFPQKESVVQRAAFFEQLFPKITALPGVESVGAVSELPLTLKENDDTFRVEGKSYPASTGLGSYDVALSHRVVGDYFNTMGIPLLRGRFLSSQDTADSARVVVISQPFAQKYFDGEDPLGKHLVLDEGKNVSREIVGVVGGVRFLLNKPAYPEIYLPYAQTYPGAWMNIVLRTNAEQAGIGPQLRAAVAAVDPEQAISEVRTMDDVLSASAAQPRFYGVLLALFALVAIALAGIGLYGVISYAVSQHTREIGIRMALGAKPFDIVRLTAAQGLQIIVLGLVAGLAGAYFAARVLASQLFGVMPHDAATFSLVPLILVTVALAACWVPVRRAMRVDPAVSLREE